MLHAVGEPYAQCNAASFAASDHVCTSLQLINFWQDMAKDALADRVYIPQEIFEYHGSPINPSTAGYQPMMQALCDDARQRMLAGAPLLSHLKGRFKAEIALTIAGGLRVLDKLAACEYDVVTCRPTLGWRDAPACLRTVWQLYRGTLK
jgi:phytoene synthase